MKILFFYLPFLFLTIGCNENNAQVESPIQTEPTTVEKAKDILPGIFSTTSYIPLLQGKKVAIVANQTSFIGNTHLVDTLLSLDMDVVKVFAPEHGFRGTKDAGEHVGNQKDDAGLEIISLYGKNKKPSDASLQDVDVVVFDIQDVGVRFYTYLSTLHYVMEACAENDKKLIVLDRPNPNAFYVDGPVLKTNERSFIGLHPVPIVYGLTIGEYAQMINGEQWLKDRVQCNLTVIPCENYDHQSRYELPIAPSPNLPNMRSIYLYPSLALFEGTKISIGRGTETPFEVIGHPAYPDHDFSFVPKSGFGAKYPKLENKTCYGMNLKDLPMDSIIMDHINLSYLLNMYDSIPSKKSFFLKNKFFNKLSGNSLLMDQIKNGETTESIRDSWETDLNIYLRKRLKYLIYEEQ